MKRKYLEAEIASHLANMPDVHPEILEEYRNQLYALNKDVDDPELMRRPGIAFVDRQTYELRRLRAKLPRYYDIRHGVAMATGGSVDPYTRSILQAMYDVGLE